MQQRLRTDHVAGEPIAARSDRDPIRVVKPRQAARVCALLLAGCELSGADAVGAMRRVGACGRRSRASEGAGGGADRFGVPRIAGCGSGRARQAGGFERTARTSSAKRPVGLDDSAQPGFQPVPTGEPAGGATEPGRRAEAEPVGPDDRAAAWHGCRGAKGLSGGGEASLCRCPTW